MKALRGHLHFLHQGVAHLIVSFVLIVLEKGGLVNQLRELQMILNIA